MSKPFKNRTEWKDHEVDVAELELQEGLLGGFIHVLNVPAAADTTAADQYDLTGGAGNMANLVQPVCPRNIKITVTDANDSVTCTITVTGKDALGRTISEVFSVAAGTGKVQTGSLIFASVSQIAISNLSGAGAGDLVDAGWQNKLGLGVVGKNLAIVKLEVGGTVEAAAASGADTYGNLYYTPTTAPNGTNDYSVWFAYSPRMWKEIS